MKRFPFADRPRLWGVAVSHYQVEGGDPCDWTAWEASGRTRGDACGDAVGSWQRYEEDVDLAHAAGANAFRFSISWSRVEPRRGRFDDDALKRYSRFVDHLVARGIEPVVTLFHYTHPAWFHDQTPWTSTASVLEFGRFAARVAAELGDRVRMWIPLNEPLVFLLAGYVGGEIPPGVADPSTINRVFDHLLAAHSVSATEIRRHNRRAAIGVAHNMMAFAPDRAWNPLDWLIAHTARAMYNRAIIEAFATGRWSFPVLAEDQAIGLAVREAGFAVVLSTLAVRNVIVHRTVRRALDRQIRWNKIRYSFSRSMYAAELLIHPLPFAILAAIVGSAPHALDPDRRHAGPRRADVLRVVRPVLLERGDLARLPRAHRAGDGDGGAGAGGVRTSSTLAACSTSTGR